MILYFVGKTTLRILDRKKKAALKKTALWIFFRLFAPENLVAGSWNFVRIVTVRNAEGQMTDAFPIWQFHTMPPSCISKNILFLCYIRFAKNGEKTTVSKPVTAMESPLMAPSMSPISMAFAVPRAWLEVPVATPRATGSVMRKILQS